MKTKRKTKNGLEIMGMGIIKKLEYYLI